jgi:hypothetical protein
MANMIYCETTAQGIQSFYITTNGETHFLFSQNFKRGVKDYFERGVMVDEAINFKRANGNSAIIRTMEKLPAYIRYVEREYGMEVLRKTARKNQTYKRKSA